MPAPKGNQYARGCKTNGAPTKYEKKYCKMLTDHMTKGLSYESFAGLIGVTRDCLYKWEKKHKDFLYSKKIGKEKMLLTLEKMGIAGIAGKIKGFNASTWIFTMKNKAAWTDNIQTDITSKGESIKLNYKLKEEE